MNHPWGLSGPEFLWLYGGGLVVAAAWAVAVRMRVRRPHLVEPAPPPDLESLAFLAGGARRVVELSVARLIETGAVRVNRHGTLSATTAAVPLNPVDAAVLQALNRRTHQLDTLLREVRLPEYLEGIAERLSAQGLVLTARAAGRAKFFSTLALKAVLLVGFVRFVNGLTESLPVGYLILLLVLTSALTAGFTIRRIPARTVHGDRVLAAARRAPTSSLALVALGGLAAFPDREIGAALTRSARVRSGSAWTYGGVGAAAAYSSCSSGGSSCGGGGSSCGGGGGGCGGGSS